MKRSTRVLWGAFAVGILAGGVVTGMGAAYFYPALGPGVTPVTPRKGPHAPEREASMQGMAGLLGNSQRLADVLSYRWTTAGKNTITADDMALIAAAKGEIEDDDAGIRMNGLLSNSGVRMATIQEGKGYYEIFNRLTLPFSEGSMFEDGIDDVVLLLPGELLRIPPCRKDTKLVLFQSEAYPKGGKPVGLGLKLEPPVGYRVTAKELTPATLKHRLVIKTSCLPPTVADKLK